MALTTIPSELSSVSGIADSSDATAITIDSSENVTFAGNILKTGDLTVDVSGVINLDAGTQVILKDDGTNYGTFYQTSSDFYIQSLVQDKDIVLYGNDGGSGIIALRLDMSEAGAATFNSTVTGAKLVSTNGVLELDDNGSHNGIINVPASMRINFDSDGNSTGESFQVGSNATNIDSNNIHFIVKEDGKVGIGTNAPTHMLHIVDGNNYAVFGDTQSNSTMSLRLCDSPTYPVEVQAYGNDLRINTASSANATPTVKMLVQYTGYVGIGETSPDNKLHITGGDWNNAHIRIERTDVGSSNDPGLVFKSAAGANDAYGLGGIWFQNALDSNAYALIRARTDDASGTSGKLEFVTSTSAVGNATTPALIIDSNGHLLPGSDATKNLGSTSKRWDNLYVNDMHFSNEGSDGNDVDGTTGDWTLQEGEEHLYIINNKSGKKFKFSLEEVE